MSRVVRPARSRRGAPLCARRWVAAVNHWGQEGRWDFTVCKDPQQLVNQLRHILAHPATPTIAPPLTAD